MADEEIDESYAVNDAQAEGLRNQGPQSGTVAEARSAVERAERSIERILRSLEPAGLIIDGVFVSHLERADAGPFVHYVRIRASLR